MRYNFLYGYYIDIVLFILFVYWVFILLKLVGKKKIMNFIEYWNW